VTHYQSHPMEAKVQTVYIKLVRP